MEQFDKFIQNGEEYIISRIENEKIYKVHLKTKEETEFSGECFKTGYLINKDRINYE